jgi:hypothetical protein
LPGDGGPVSKAIDWLFIGSGRVLLLFALSLSIIFAWANLENEISWIWLTTIGGRTLILLVILASTIIAAAIIEKIETLFVYKFVRAFSLLIILLTIPFSVVCLFSKGFPSTTPLFWLIALLIIWAFLMILFWPVMLPIGWETWDLIKLKLFFFAKGPISLFGRFRRSQEHYLVGPVKHFFVATAIILLFTYNKTDAVMKGRPLENLTQWALNGTTWLGNVTTSLLINGSKIQNNLTQSATPPEMLSNVLNNSSIFGGEISNVTNMLNSMNSHLMDINENYN